MRVHSAREPTAKRAGRGSRSATSEPQTLDYAGNEFHLVRRSERDHPLWMMARVLVREKVPIVADANPSQSMARELKACVAPRAAARLSVGPSSWSRPRATLASATPNVAPCVMPRLENSLWAKFSSFR